MQMNDNDIYCGCGEEEQQESNIEYFQMPPGTTVEQTLQYLQEQQNMQERINREKQKQSEITEVRPNI